MTDIIRGKKILHMRNGDVVEMTNYRITSPLMAPSRWFIDADEGRFVIDATEIAWSFEPVEPVEAVEPVA